MGNVDDDRVVWKGKPVQCQHKSLRKGNYTFYESFVLRGEIFFAGDFALCKSTPGVKAKTRVCRLMTLYLSNESWHANAKNKALVRWYTWARDLENRLNPTRIKFDEGNEVIEDYRGVDVVITLENIVKKCRVVFATEEDPVYLIKRERLDRNLYFSCRYKIIADELQPIFSANSDWDEKDVFTTLSVHNSSVASLKDLKSPLKRKSPSGHDSENTAKNSKLTPKMDLLNIASPKQKSSVKRNLNESFADIPDSADNTPVLNYSIASPGDDPVKIKLRLSQKQNPRVILKKLDEATIKLFSPKSESEKLEEESSGLRRSNRAVERKSYVELISPEKFTPKKRTRRLSSISGIGEERTPVRSSSRLKRNIAESPERFAEGVKPETKRTHAQDYYVSASPAKPDTPRTRRKSILKTTANECATPTKHIKLYDDYNPETPKRNRNVSTPKSLLKSTPGSRLKQIKEGIITPSIQRREGTAQKGDTPLMKARSQLHVSHVPEALPCREREYADVFLFLKGKLQDGCGGCMYISGVPGTGKTATVTAVIRTLQEMSKDGDIAEFDYVNLNGMRLTEPRQAYVEILKQLTGKTVLWEQAQTILDTRFSKGKKSAKPVVMLVDELDVLCTKRQDVVYNLLDWPTKANTQLIVVTIANTMDLPERLLMGRVTSRLGLTRLTFQPYSYKQLQEIVSKRLEGINTFNPDAIQLVARKVASVSGDARRALDICRRAAELAEREGARTLVTMTHVNDALDAMITQPKVQAIKHCSRLEQLVLQAVVAEAERTGVEETTFGDVYTMLASLATLDGFRAVSRSRALGAVNRLGACRLLLTDQKSSDLFQKIILNVSADDVYYALRKD